jgi:ribonuclease P protein component
MAKRFGFGKAEKLKSRKAIDQLYLEGKTFAVFPVRVTYRFMASTEPTVLVGITVSKRNFKRAVDRNRIKRLLREAYRLQKTGLLEAAQSTGKIVHLFFMYTDKTIPPFQQVKEAINISLRRLERKLIEHNAGNT